MSPFRGAERNSRMFGRNLNVDVDVNESIGSDWDCESENVEDGEALVRMRPFKMVLVFKMLSFHSFRLNTKRDINETGQGMRSALAAHDHKPSHIAGFAFRNIEQLFMRDLNIMV